MIKHIFTDMDGTIVDSKLKITKETIDALHSSNKDIIVVSGQDIEHMDIQLDGLKCIKMAQSGNISPLWYNQLSSSERDDINEHIRHIKTVFKEYINHNRTDHVKDLGGQINFSFIGHNGDYEEKIHFDPDRKKRKLVLKILPFKNSKYVCSVGGTTCLEYIKKENTKGANIERYIKEMGWNKNECVYFGDALFPEGNDYSVIGVIKTIEVKGPLDLINKLKKL